MIDTDFSFSAVIILIMGCSVSFVFFVDFDSETGDATVTYPDGHTITFDYLNETDPYLASGASKYDENGNLIKEVNPNYYNATTDDGLSKIKPGEVGVIDIGKYAWEASGWFWKFNPEGKNLNKLADSKDYQGVLDVVNQGDKGSKLIRNSHINDMYKILTGKELGLPE